MKRSEFYDKFNTFVKDWEGSNLTAYNQFAKAMLEFLEKEIGMLPPGDTENIPHTLFKEEINEIFSWEPEDEKK
jgi:hypothetical protein